MTVETVDITSGPYAGNDVADTFSYSFRVMNKNQLIVYETSTTGVVSELDVDSDYTVNGIGEDAGGTITRIAGALPAGYSWYIRANYQPTQLTDLESQGGFFPDVHEKSFDKLTFLIQQILDKYSRTPSIPDFYTGGLPITLDAPQSGRFLRWKSDLSGLENVVAVESDPDNPVQLGTGDIPYSFINVADMTSEGQGVVTAEMIDTSPVSMVTQGYYESGGTGAAGYVGMTLAQYRGLTGVEDDEPDGYVDHWLFSEDSGYVAVLKTDGTGELNISMAGAKRDTTKTYDNLPHIYAAWNVANTVLIPAGYHPIGSTLRYPSNSKSIRGVNYSRYTSEMSSLVPTSDWTVQVETVPAFAGSSFTPDFVPHDVIVNKRVLSQEASGLDEWFYNEGTGNVTLRNAVLVTDVVEYTANNIFIDINENDSTITGAGRAEGGQFNKIKDLYIRLDADWQNDADTRRYMTGVKGRQVREGTTLENVIFRRCGIPFNVQGYITYFNQVDVSECYIGPCVDSTFSASLDNFNLIDCHRNWGRLRRCTANNSTWQQSPSVGALEDDKGVTCHLNVVFTGYFYTEGGTRQIWCEADPISGKHEDVIVENGILGFAQMAAGGYGASNIRVTTGSKFKFRGKNGSIASKSFVCDGSPQLADTVWFDFVNSAEVADNGKIFAAGKENPSTPNLFIRNAIGTQSRVLYENEINYNRVELTSQLQVAEIFDLAEHASRIGGKLEIKAEGPNAYDVFDVYFGYSTEGDFQFNVIERVRNSGVSGIAIDTSDNEKVKIRTSSAGTFRISYQCSAFGFIEMKAPIITTVGSAYVAPAPALAEKIEVISGATALTLASTLTAINLQATGFTSTVTVTGGSLSTTTITLPAGLYGVDLEACYSKSDGSSAQLIVSGQLEAITGDTKVIPIPLGRAGLSASGVSTASVSMTREFNLSQSSTLQLKIDGNNNTTILGNVAESVGFYMRIYKK